MMGLPALFRAALVYLLLSPLAAQIRPYAEAGLGSSMVVVGEDTYLTLWTQGVTIIDWPDTPSGVAPLVLRREQKTPIQVNGYIRDGYIYRVSALQPGIYRIPPFEFQTASGVIRTKSLTLRAFSADRLSTHGIKIAGIVTPYLTGVFLEKNSPYVGEVQNAEAKLYLSQAPPNRLRLEDGKVIQFQKDGLAAWRFTTTPEATGFLDYDGHRFLVYTYRSTINALRSGSLSLGPGQCEAFLSQRARAFSGNLEFPSAVLEVLPLPDGAPVGFSGAVGSFSMDVRPLATEVEQGAPLTIEVTIQGRGNLEQFPGPQLVDPGGQWKIFDMIAKPGGRERRNSSGTAAFSQVVRPLEVVTALPPYRFVYFDPSTKGYRTIESPAIPVTITGNTNRVGDSSDHPAFLPPGNLPLRTFDRGGALPIWAWQVIPGSIVLFLIGTFVRRKFLSHKMARKPAQEFDLLLSQVENCSHDRVRFYREAARFATEWRGGEEFNELYRLRDEICFRADTRTAPVEESEKKRILDLLRSLSPVLLVGLLTVALSNSLHATDFDPAGSKDEILRLMESQPSREHYHNLSICENALGNGGAASLWAHRFILQGGDADDLFEGLPGIHAKEREWLDWLSVFSRSTYLQITIAGLWGGVILWLTSSLYQNICRKALIVGLSILSPSVLVVGGLSWFLYPKEISFQPLHQLSVVTGSDPMLGQPFEGGEIMMTTLEGSLCKTTDSRGGWCHITLPGGLSGWIREEEVTPISPF